MKNRYLLLLLLSSLHLCAIHSATKSVSIKTTTMNFKGKKGEFSLQIPNKLSRMIHELGFVGKIDSAEKRNYNKKFFYTIYTLLSLQERKFEKNIRAQKLHMQTVSTQITAQREQLEKLQGTLTEQLKINEALKAALMLYETAKLSAKI